MAEDRPISLRFPKSVLDECSRRVMPGADSDREYLRSDVIRAAIQRYYEICRRHFAALGLSHGELALCADALNGVWLTSSTDHGAAQLSVVWAGIADAIRLERLDEKHSVDGKKLIAKLQSSSYADLIALVDFVERFWADDAEADAAVSQPKTHTPRKSR